MAPHGAKPDNGESLFRVGASTKGGGVKNRYAIGFAATLLGASCWGFSGPCMQFVFSNYEVPVLFVAAFRLLVAGLVLSAILLVVKHDEMVELLHDGRAMGRVVVFGLLGLFFCQASYMFAIDYTNAGTATVLQAFNVVIVLAVTCIASRRAPHAMEFLAVCLAIFATALIATKGDFSTLQIPALGLFWGLASAVGVAIYVCYPKPLYEHYSAMPVAGLGMFIGGLAATLVLVVSEFAGADASAAAFSWVGEIDGVCVVYLLIIAILGTLVAYGVYLYGVSIVGSVTGSLLGTVEPAAANIISAVWLKTSFSWADWLGMVLMIATVFIVSLQPTRD